MLHHRIDPELTERRRRLSRSLWILADLIGIDERRSFRSRAFRAGSWAIDFIEDPFSMSRKDLLAVDGIGEGIADLIDEFGQTDGMARLEELRRRFPIDARRMIGLPRMTPGRLQALRTTLAVDTIRDLIDAVHSESVETLEGIGPATADRWLQILALAPDPAALTAHEAALRSASLRAHLERLLGSPIEVLESGAVRRLDEWALRLDLVVVTNALEETYHRLATTAIGEVDTQADTELELRLHDGVVVDMTLTDGRSAGSALFSTTGTELGVVARAHKDAHAREVDVFTAADLPWIPPPARQRQGGVPADLVTIEDIRGDLHIHSERSADGRMPLEEIVTHALERNYEYIALTDHTVGLGFGGLDADGLKRQREEVDTIRQRFPDLAVFHGAEINVDPHGLPDIDDDTLGALDFVVAGCHSHFDLPCDVQTRRVTTAISHPAVKVLAHPFGRRIGIRPGFELDFEAVLEAARRCDTALEVNGHRDRMDLSAGRAARAVQAGVWLAADSDAHRVPELDNMSVSVGVLQRGHVRCASVVNTMPLERFRRWIAGVSPP